MTTQKAVPPRGGDAGKWAATVASVWIQCAAGSSYCFGVYSPLLKASQEYDQSTLDSVAFFKDVGANAGIFSGLLVSCDPRGRHRWVVLAAGAALCFAGYLPMWLSVMGYLQRPPVALMCVFMLLAAQSQTFFNTANVVTVVENFPDSRGTVIGIMKGFLGLSGAILVQVYQTTFRGNASSFLLMLALLPTLLSLSLMCVVQVHCTNRRDDKQHLNAFSIISLVVAGYLMLVIIGEHVFALGLSGHILVFVILLLLLLSPLSIVIRARITDSEMPSEGFTHETTRLIDNKGSFEAKEQIHNTLLEAKDCVDHEHIAPEKVPSSSRHGSADRDDLLLTVGENLNLLEAMCTCNFWLLFLAIACGLGSGLATVNNISQIGASLGYTSMETSTLISLWSIWNFLGRFGVGYISDYLLRTRGYARPLFIVMTLAVMSIGHLVISSGISGALYMGSIIVGVCYGSLWVLMPSITSEIFGIRHFGTIFNTVAVGSPFGSYILSVRLVGYIYDMESSRMQTCSGRHCFMLSFLIMASVCIFGSVVALALFMRTRMFYKQVIVPRLQSLAAP